MEKFTAAELRPGNLLFYNLGELDPSDFDEVEEIDSETIWHMDGDDHYQEGFSKIPLDDKMLEILGCKKAPPADGYGGYLTPAFGEKKASLRIKDNKWSGEYSDVELKYVHQLQNLIYVLFGVELPHPPAAEINAELEKQKQTNK
jgi:hypothetical protein